uniref:Cytochrome P450 n=1 Tax=Brachionus rotundiformis TaxID=96890 RepID=A0A5J6KCP0_9BILA|nr:cytochrome P450 [Brachionus rotundiformis]
MKKNFAFTVKRSLSSNQTLKRFEDLPGPRSYPIIGNLPELKAFGGDLEFNPFDKFCLDLHEKYGDLVRWSILGNNNLFVFRPDHAKIVFQNEGPSPSRPSVIPWDIYSKRKNYPPGLVNSQGETWKKQRRASNPILAKPQAVSMYLDTHNTIIDEFIISLKKKSLFDESFIIAKFETELKYVLLEMMSIVAFDQRLQCINPDRRSPEILKLFKSIKEYGDLTSQLFYNIPIWKYFRTKLWKEFENTSDYVYDFTRKYVTESYNYVKNLNEKAKHTMLQQFLLNNNNLSVDDIISIMSEFLLAAFDTTATTLHFWLHRISTNSDIQEEIFDEIMKLDKKDWFIDQEDLGKIPLLKASLKESQRLHSIAPTNGRVLPNDIILDNYLIPKNTTINVGFFVMGKSEKYFKNPEKFDPKRWLKENESEPINPYTTMPFGFGSRMCIGRRLAEQKMYLIMIKILRNFKLEYVGEDAKLGFRLIVVPDYDLKLKFIPRKI